MPDDFVTVSISIRQSTLKAAKARVAEIKPTKVGPYNLSNFVVEALVARLEAEGVDLGRSQANGATPKKR